MELNVRQEAFCMHYAKTGNATEAYKAAGYNVKNDNAAAASATTLLRNPKIQKRLQGIVKEINSEKIADIKEIQEYLTAVMRREEKENIVVTLTVEKSEWKPDEDGKMRKVTTKQEVPKLVEIPAKLSDANKAAETLAKMQGGFDNKMQVEITVPVFEGEDSLED